MLDNEVENTIGSVSSSMATVRSFGYQSQMPYIVTSDDATPTTTAL